MGSLNFDRSEFELTIGIEIHAQILSKSKLFSESSTKFGSIPNSCVSLLDVAMPGTLPVLNEYCVHQAIKTGLALNGNINNKSIFDRKHYFYPDLPQGYQISQFYLPIVQHAYLMIYDQSGVEKKIDIPRIHLEQDAGKSIHDHDSYTKLDFNRAGIGLMEIVSAPLISSAYEASEYVKNLRSILQYIGTCDGNMEEGSLRCDVNISIKRKLDTSLGTRCEIKNINSISNIVKAIEFEAERQFNIINSGGSVIQETRLFDTISLTTRVMRNKEDVNDYRYFQDFDLLPVEVSEELVESIRGTITELPVQKVTRYVQDFGINFVDAKIITADLAIANYFESVLDSVLDPKIIANWIIGELFASLNKSSITIAECNVTPKMLNSMLHLLKDNVISGKIAKQVFDIMFTTAKDPNAIVKEYKLLQISDQEEISSVVDNILDSFSDEVQDYRNGKVKLFGFFVGQVMKHFQGKADPKIVNEILQAKL
ncbi:Asp-tRNA(Asn)/Glu-tRNA(Gln) amidotransferase subunit GatB [Rickettsia endosymbiont of Cardiosporidium cionae]|uniref:Asp-tRNA(Asn)/Glu-tRNA(Gln) amidotransferase subunit GatB n=1 Tax=Rickettsia endosymbiont of Cardiosporidium cionae TaxID=2777155 RepID=UPI001893F1BD|nr:Asp-tRNA(Asn)/Glu-tRNA(Gln) amidotransferase subunit GatB [Rickettsia endosymbiont of Cardiosporidium cionae]KAF8818214.1 Asp-tRNA(Asn)/Glu-tRNA(Gln) amidotransferase subunit GatB [Rickettsia endosymbiont of Cardiosporidium cionae]